jgi:exosortase H (IPTLxxWG-CTERM-specific)
MNHAPTPPRRWSAFRCGVGFLGIAALLQIATATDLADRWVGQPLCSLVARISALVLSLLGNTSLDGTRLTFEGFSVLVADPCNGVLPTTIYLAAVLAFPSTWRARLYGILIGVPGIFFVNLIRVVSLLLVGARWATAFEDVHIYVWQTLVIALTMALWIFWVERFVRPGEAVPSGA